MAQTESQRKWYKDNKPSVLASQKKWYSLNREKAKANRLKSNATLGELEAVVQDLRSGQNAV